MSQFNVTVDTLPPGAIGYQYAVFDVPGTVLSNNFLSVFNPPGSIKTLAFLEVIMHSYSIGSSTTPNSLIAYRTTAASGGTLITPSAVTKFVTVQANAVAEVRVGNPSVTLLAGSVPLAGKSPPINSGLGATSASSATNPGGVLALAGPGEGLVINTAVGNVNQMWGAMLAWAEF